MAIRDPVERVVAEALQTAGIAFVHEADAAGRAETRGLDFLLPDSGVYIECKRFHSDRIAAQTARVADVIVIQGMGAARAFAAMLARPAAGSDRTAVLGGRPDIG